MIKLASNELSLSVTILLILLLGFIGYLLFKAIKLPAPGLTGSLVINAAATSLGVKWAGIPMEIIILIHSLIGIMVGSQFGKDKIKQLRVIALPSILVGFWMTIVGLCLGFAIYKITDIDIGTSLFSAAPGGMSEMSALAFMYNLDVPIVVLFQFIRIVMIYISIPIIVSYYSKKSKANKTAAIKVESMEKAEEKKDYPTIITIAVGIVASIVAWETNIPGGAIMGSLIVIGGCRSLGVKLKALPPKYIVATQIGLGATLGLTFTPEVAVSLTSLFGITILFSLLIVLNSIILGIVIHKLFKIDLATSLLACASAGVSQMSAIALDMDADAVIVSVIQSIRLSTIVLILPPIIIYIIG